MDIRATKINVGDDIDGNIILTLTVPHEYALTVSDNIGKLSGLLDVEIKKHRERRSLNANALLWKCLDSMAEILDATKEEMYLQMLERYGVQKFLVVHPEAAESTKKLFRIAEEMGKVSVNGKTGVQLRVIVGSSQYDTEQMSRLLRGTINDCREIGAFVPDESDIGASIDLWEKEK